LIRTLESGVNALPFGKTNFPCSSSVAIILVSVYDSATGEKNVIRQPSNSQSLDFETVEVISRDNIIPSADLKNKYLDFSKQHGWKESSNLSVKRLWCFKIFFSNPCKASN
jgi:hypothetical protein